jgi:hypothetical protein
VSIKIRDQKPPKTHRFACSGSLELLQRVRSLDLGSPLPWTKIRDEIHDEYKQASTADRVILLDIYKAMMDIVEPNIGPADLDAFRTARRQDYNLLLISECIVGGGDVSPEAIEAVTRREVAAGRMAADDELRRLAIIGPEGLERFPVMLQHILRERRSWCRPRRTTVARTVRCDGEVPLRCARRTCAGMP